MNAAGARRCGSCSLCCSVLRVDDLAKLGGRPCMHQIAGAGCAVHAVRPNVCRAYRCAWLAGAFRDDDRPDRLGAVLDLVPRGECIRLVIRQAEPDAFDRSARLRAIAEEMRCSMLVEIRDVEDVLDPERPFRVLQPDGDELRVRGDRIEVLRAGRVVERRRLPWLERIARGVTTRVTSWRISRWPSHEQRARSLAGAEGSAPGVR